MIYGTVQAYRTPGGGQLHFGGSSAPVFGHVVYIAIPALILNVVVSAVLTVVFRAVGARDGYDVTRPSDYTIDPHPDAVAVPQPRAVSPATNLPANPVANSPTGHEARNRASGSPRSDPR